jgi:AraC family transcriptional regulator
MLPAEPRIETLSTKKLIGNALKMSFDNNRTAELWQGFMPRRREIKGTVSTDLFCMQIYENVLTPTDFNERTEFEKWAAAEVSEFKQIPDGMMSYTITGGLYAVFIYKGMPVDFRETFNYIFYEWLPNSKYDLDQREHFEILGDKYKNNDPDSEEEIWVPVKRKA